VILLDASVLLAAEDQADRNHGASLCLVESSKSLATLDLAAFEAVNAAVRGWRDDESAARLRERVFAIERFGELIRVDEGLVERSHEIATEYGITVYDAGYVAAAERAGAVLVSCDEEDLVSRGLARLPAGALD